MTGILTDERRYAISEIQKWNDKNFERELDSWCTEHEWNKSHQIRKIKRTSVKKFEKKRRIRENIKGIRDLILEEKWNITPEHKAWYYCTEKDSSVIFEVKVVVKGLNNYYRKNSWKHAEKFRKN